MSWYATLIKPSFAPPSWVFGPVWSLLYVLIIISFGALFIKAARREVPLKTALPFILNIAFNLLFSPLQFGLENNLLAMLDIFLVLGTLVWALVAVWRKMRWVAWINVPYLLWVIFATVLQVSITVLNW